MPSKRKKPMAEAADANPEWTKADFARAVRPERILSPKILAAFKNTRGPQKAPVKDRVGLRLALVITAGYWWTASTSFAKPFFTHEPVASWTYHCMSVRIILASTVSCGYLSMK